MQKRTPDRRQIDSAECGAACMGSLLQFHGRYVPPPVIREKCEVNRDGSRAAALIRAARFYGLDGKGFRATAQQIDQLTLPAVIHWRNSHFVILEGFDKRHVYINDPAAGHRRISWRQFEARYSGVALTFSRTEHFQPGGRPPRLLSSLFSRLENRAGVIAYCLIAALIATVPTLFFAIGCRVFVDDCIVRGDHYPARPLLWILLVATLVQSFLFWIKATTLRNLRVSLKQSMSRNFLTRLMEKPILYFTKRFSSEVACRVRLNDRVAESISHLALDTLAGLIASVCYAIVLFALCPLLALIAIILISLNLLIVRMANRQRTELSQQMAISEGRMLGVAIETANSIEMVQGGSLQEFSYKRWHHHWRETVQTELNIETSNTMIGSFSKFSTLLASTAIIGLGCLLVIQGQTTLGTLIAFQVISPFLMMPIVKAVEAISFFQTLLGDLAKLDDVIESELEFEQQPDSDSSEEEQLENENLDSGSNEPDAVTELVANEICFGFRADGTGLLDRVSVDVGKGQWLGLAGQSGSGKSTLARILGGLYPATQGSVRIGSNDFSDIGSAKRAQLVGYVNQQSVLFPGTLRENFCFGIETRSDEEILAVCDELNLLELVQSFPGGLGGTIVGNGTNVSGGERQRIDIARTLLANPPILILDEGTSALDQATEQAVIDAIRRRGTTCVMVSHRLSILEECDTIMLLEAGNEVARGSHQELASSSPEYQNILDQDGDENE